MSKPSDTGKLISREALMKKVAQLAPGYLANRRKEVDILTQALTEGDFTTIRKLGHKIKGSGMGYGFPQLSVIGEQLEDHAEAQAGDGVRDSLNQLIAFLDTHQPLYPA